MRKKKKKTFALVHLKASHVKHLKLISSQISVINKCRQRIRKEREGETEGDGWKTRKGGVRYIFIYEAL